MSNANNSRVSRKEALKYPIGIDDYYNLITDHYIYVDKSLRIIDVLQDSPLVSLITRPRRFGKTLFMSMLRYFCAANVRDRATNDLFTHSLLAQQQNSFMKQHQGQYSVIYLTLKGIEPNTFNKAIEGIQELLSQLFSEHEAILVSGKLNDLDSKTFKCIMHRQASMAQYENALLYLSRYLNIVYQKPVIILIDEYDTPIQTAYRKGFYTDFIDFMRKFLGQALKENPFLYKGIITGITRIAKESLFSDLNNITVNTILNNRFSNCFGFTATETATLLQQTGYSSLQHDIQAWYNGYHIGTETLYNPWSIINCLYEQGACKPYWVNTSSNGLLITALAKATSSAKIALEQLLQQQTITVDVDLFTHLDRLDFSDAALWNLFLTSGYLTATTIIDDSGLLTKCQLRIPNREIAILLTNIVNYWFHENLNARPYNELLQTLINGDIARFRVTLKNFLRQTASYFDPGGNNPEKFYHGLILGLMVSLQTTHHVLSNREAGFGRYDLAIIPRDKQRYPVAIIMEFKTRLAEKQSLTQLANAALAQIQVQHYHDALIAADHPQQLLLGLAFQGKQVEVAHSFEIRQI